MGALQPGVTAAEQPAAGSVQTVFSSLPAAEQHRHETVLGYWLSVRGDREFPPLHDLDPLELSDAGPNSVLMELISGGHDAEIRHLGEALREEAWPERIVEAPKPSVLSCIAKKLPIVAISRDFLCFEDQYQTALGKTRCSVTLLPLSAGGAWVDYVYAFVTTEQAEAQCETALEAGTPDCTPEPQDEPHQATAEVLDVSPASGGEQPGEERPRDEPANGQDAVATNGEATATVLPGTEAPDAEDIGDCVTSEHAEETRPEPEVRGAPGFSKLLDSLAGLAGFYGSQPVKIEAAVEEAAPHDEQGAAPYIDEPGCADAEVPCASEPDQTGAASRAEPEECANESRAEAASHLTEESLQNKLSQVRAKAEEARLARERANAALYEGLGAAYDFALDAEDAPEEYLRLVEGHGLKIQLRSPMKPVVKLAFAGVCDEPTIKQLEAVLAWAFEEELPRGTLAERIEAAGGIDSVLAH